MERTATLPGVRRRTSSLGVLALVTVAVGITAGVSVGGTGLFSWFRPSLAPAGWRHVALPSGSAVFFYPARFRLVAGDPGTASAEIRDRAGNIIGYLNATPQQGHETLGDWPAFRIAHQRDEETSVREEARAFGLAFRGGTGSCVIDDYTTATKHRYREIACFVRGRYKGSVIVAAATPTNWKNNMGDELEQAISAYQAR
jgi:hypothetical protein